MDEITAKVLERIVNNVQIVHQFIGHFSIYCVRWLAGERKKKVR